MDLLRILFGEDDAFLHTNNMIEKEPEPEPAVARSLSKFDNDVAALRSHIGDSEFQDGISIVMTLGELLEIVPRARRRRDAYTTLIKHLKEQYNITLTIQ